MEEEEEQKARDAKIGGQASRKFVPVVAAVSDKSYSVEQFKT